MIPPEPFLNALAEAFAGGDWQLASLLSRAEARLGKRYRWMPALVKRLLGAIAVIAPSSAVIREFLARDQLLARHYRNAITRGESWPVPFIHHLRAEYKAPQWLTGDGVSTIANPSQLGLFLGLTPWQIDWFADTFRDQCHQPADPRQHYQYRWLAKRSGGYRLLAAPKSKLKAIQRDILFGILASVPPHSAAHGFRVGHSTRTFVEPHVKQHLVLRMDLRHFFPSIGRAQVTGIFRALGYPEPVAELLARLCTQAVPEFVWKQLARDRSCDDEGERLLLARYHLPQGAPTSPALANLAAYTLDCRLQGLAQSVGGRYTRYADDLLFSGDEAFARGAQRLTSSIATIAAEEGFQVHHRKTRLMRSGVRQHAAGLVLNEKTNIDRRDYDRLKATLCNCVRHGPASQNRQHHPHFRVALQSHVAYVEQINLERGAKLRTLFEKIKWEEQREIDRIG